MSASTPATPPPSAPSSNTNNANAAAAPTDFIFNRLSDGTGSAGSNSTAPVGSVLYSSVINGSSQDVSRTSISIRPKTGIPFTSELELIDQSDRWTPTISDTPGRATFLIYDSKSNKKIAKKADMILQSISFQRREAQSIIKNVRGITFQAIDSHPLIITIGGYLINSRDDEALAREGDNPIGRALHTHWFIQFLKDYEEISASRAIRSGYDVLFSVEDFTAQVFILNQTATLTSQYPNLSNFSVTLLAINQNYRGALDLKESGDLSNVTLEAVAEGDPGEVLSGLEKQNAILGNSIVDAIGEESKLTIYSDKPSRETLEEFVRNTIERNKQHD
jgi:hypothetical protein